MSIRRLFTRRKKVPFAEWGFQIQDFRLPAEGRVQFAKWLHPYDRAAPIAQAEVDGLRQFIRPGDFAIDVGAHCGDTTVPMALAAGRGGCVLALEPNPYVFKVLRMNAGLNPALTRIVPECVAATERDGASVFQYSDASYCNGGGGTKWWLRPFKRTFPLSVVGRNLMRMLQQEYAQWLPRLSYVKVDAEGYDRVVLESIAPLLRHYQPVVRTEVFRKLGRAERRRLYDLLAGCGYHVHRFVGGAEPCGPRIERDGMSAERHFDVLALPRERRSLSRAA